MHRTSGAIAAVEARLYTGVSLRQASDALRRPSEVKVESCACERSVWQESTHVNAFSAKGMTSPGQRSTLACNLSLCAVLGMNSLHAICLQAPITLQTSASCMLSAEDLSGCASRAPCGEALRTHIGCWCSTVMSLLMISWTRPRRQ